jgi:heat shock protein HslJ
MRIARFGISLILALVSVSLQAQSAEQPITLMGKLVRAMAIGGESTGWNLELDSAATVDGKQVASIQVRYRKTRKLERLQDKHVRVTGTITHQQGVETGEQPVLNVSSIKAATASAQSGPAPTASFSLSKSEWLLNDLSGSVLVDNVQATLAFPEEGKVAGNGSCNRFSGPVEIKGHAIKLGPLASTRMACPEPVMNQETKYLQKLPAAERFEWKDPFLFIYCKGSEKPLRFTRMTPRNAATP